MTVHNACTSGTSRVFTVESLQLLKMEAPISTPANSEVRSIIKFLNALSIAPIEINLHLYQVYGHTRFRGQHISWRSSAERCLIIIHPIARASRLVISIRFFSYTSINSCLVIVCVFKMTERRRWVSQWCQSQTVEFYDTGYKNWFHGMTNVSFPEANMLKNSSTIGVFDPISLYIKTGFYFCKRPARKLILWTLPSLL